MKFSRQSIIGIIALSFFLSSSAQAENAGMEPVSADPQSSADINPNTDQAEAPADKNAGRIAALMGKSKSSLGRQWGLSILVPF